MGVMRHWRDASGAWLRSSTEPPPDGIECPAAPTSADMVWDGAAWGYPPAIVEAQRKAGVLAERDRRASVTRTVDIGDVVTPRPIPVQCDPVSRQNLRDLRAMARENIIDNDATPGSAPLTMQFRDADNVMQTVTNQEMITIARTVAAQVDALYKRAWLLIDDPAGIPADYTDEVYWI